MAHRRNKIEALSYLVRSAAVTFVAMAPACGDSAIIGGLCPADCGTATADAGQDACSDGLCVTADASSGCLAGPYALTRRPSALYLVLDDSATLTSQWPAILDALDSFFADPASEGLEIALQFFGNACDPAQYAPVAPMGTLPGAAVALRSAIPSLPMQSSSTLPGLQGALAQARGWAAAHNASTVSVLLVTDALPAECDASIPDYATLRTEVVRDALEGTPSVRTFVVGFGVEPVLTDLARAGGTSATIFGQGGTAPAILNALRSVRDNAPSCAFTLPDGVSLDSPALAKLAVDSQLSSSLQDQASDCDGQQGGFYLAGNTAPALVVACPQVCNSLRPSTSVRLWTNCETGTVSP